MDYFYSCGLSTLSFGECEAKVDIVLIQTFSAFWEILLEHEK